MTFVLADRKALTARELELRRLATEGVHEHYRHGAGSGTRAGWVSVKRRREGFCGTERCIRVKLKNFRPEEAGA